MENNYYCKGWTGDGYQVNSKGQGDCKVAVFVEENSAKDFTKYRNFMLDKYNTTDVIKYKHKR